MALFTNEDAHRLLLVSQLVQVDPPTIRDDTLNMSTFVKQWYTTVVRLASPNFTDMVTAEDWILNLQHLMRLNELAKLILGSLADRGKVFSDHLISLNYESTKHPSSRLIMPTTNVQHDHYIDAADLEERWGANSPMEMLFINVVQQLQTACLHPERVKRCEICCNPYLSQRATGKNKFCSERCSKRNYARKRRAKLLTQVENISK